MWKCVRGSGTGREDLPKHHSGTKPHVTLADGRLPASLLHLKVSIQTSSNS